MAESVDSILRAQYDLSERERCRDCWEESNFPPRSVQFAAHCHELSCWQAKTSSCGHAGWSLKSGGCSDCAFPFFLLKASIPDHEDQTRCNHLNYIFEGTANHNKNILLGVPSKAMLAIHSVDWVTLARWRLCQSDSVRTCLFGSCRRIRLTSRKAFLFGVWLLLDVPDVEGMGHIQAFSVLGVDDSMAWAWVAEKLCVEHPVCVAELADLKSPTCSEVHGVALNIDRCQV